MGFARQIEIHYEGLMATEVFWDPLREIWHPSLTRSMVFCSFCNIISNHLAFTYVDPPSTNARINPNSDLHWNVTHKKVLSEPWAGPDISNPLWQWSFRKHWRETKVVWQVSLCTSLWQNEFHAPFRMLFIAHL